MSLIGLIIFWSLLNSMKFNPPNTVAYWSCQPPETPRCNLSAWKASYAISYWSHLSVLNWLKQPKIAAVTVAEPPNPELIG